MVVGDHLDFLYGLAGPIAAGTYGIAIESDASGNGGVLLAEVDDLHPVDGGTLVTPIISASYTLDGGTAVGDLIDVKQMVAAVPAACGDTLRLRVSMPSGPDDGSFGDIQPVLTIP